MSSLSDKLKRNISVKKFGRTQSKSRMTVEAVHKELEEGEEQPLHQAAAEGQLAEVKGLIKKGYDPNTVDSNGWAPLHCAAMNGKYVTDLLYIYIYKEFSQYFGT